MAKWSRPEVIGVGAVGLVVAMFIAATTLTWQGPMNGTTINYEVDVFSGRINPSWGGVSEAKDPVFGLLESDRLSGVSAEPPGNLGFRGVVLTSPDLPGNGTIRDYRILRDGYYIEFANGSVRYVLDPAPWLAIRDEVQSSIDPRVWQILVDAGVT